MLTRPPRSVHDLDDHEDLSGVYELTAHSWDEAVTILSPHPITSELVQTDHFVRHLQGDLVHLEHKEARRLLNAGAVRRPGVEEDLQVQRLERLIANAQADLERQRERHERLRKATEEKQASFEEQWAAGAATDKDRQESEKRRQRAAEAEHRASSAVIASGGTP